MSLPDAVNEYARSPFGPLYSPLGQWGCSQRQTAVAPLSDGLPHHHIYCLTCSDCEVGSGNFESNEDDNCAAVVLMVSAVAATFSTLVFAHLSITSFYQGKEHARSHGNADSLDTQIIYSKLTAERMYSASAHATISCGSALLITLCILALLKKHAHLHRRIGLVGGALTTSGGLLFIVRVPLLNCVCGSSAEAKYQEYLNHESTPSAPTKEELYRNPTSRSYFSSS